MKLSELLAHIKDGEWDWPENEYFWLDAGISRQEADGSFTSIFFIHGGRIRHQAHIPFGHYEIETFIEKLRERAAGLDDVRVNWVSDTGGGDPGFWIEGTRLPNDEDVSRLEAAKTRQEEQDQRTIRDLKFRGAL